MALLKVKFKASNLTPVTYNKLDHTCPLEEKIKLLNISNRKNLWIYSLMTYSVALLSELGKN